jgi:hypothetical protein
MAIEITCHICGKSFLVKPFNASLRKYCSKQCANEALKIRFSGENNPAYGKTYRSKETHPEWAQKISNTSKGKINLGDKNGMKQPKARAKASKTRRERVTSDPEYLKNLSEKISQAWADGKYEHVNVGRCKWYDHLKPDGSIVKLQGTWEVVLAKHLDKLNIAYQAHVGRIKYVDDNGEQRSYYPDFYVPAVDCYLDVKGVFFNTLQEHKFELIRASNVDMNIVIVDKERFMSWGIDVKRESDIFRESVFARPCPSQSYLV